LLKRISGEELQGRYCVALRNAATSYRSLTASILGFHETGGKWTPAQYEEWSTHPSIRVRLAVMRCFAASRFDGALPWLRLAVAAANNPALGKAAMAILSRQPFALSLDEVLRLLRASEPDFVRLRGYCLLCARGKWEQLPILFRLTRDSTEEIRHRATLRLVAWLQGFNRSQIQPSQDQIESALAELSQSKAVIATALYDEFDALLRAMVPEASRRSL
jgi:hypothetical protein